MSIDDDVMMTSSRAHFPFFIHRDVDAVDALVVVITNDDVIIPFPFLVDVFHLSAVWRFGSRAVCVSDKLRRLEKCTSRKLSSESERVTFLV